MCTRAGLSQKQGVTGGFCSEQDCSGSWLAVGEDPCNSLLFLT